MTSEPVQAASQTAPGSVTPGGDKMTTRDGPFAVFRSLDEIPAGFGPTVAAVGNFDGVHLGHRAILAAAAAEARSTGARSVAITFDPHPEQFLRPARAPRLITPLPERLRLLGETGIDAALVLTFDAALARLSPREFVQRTLIEALGVRAMHEGQNFRFGHGATAGVRELAALGEEFGFAVHVQDAVRVRGLEVSSSAIRALVGSGGHSAGAMDAGAAVHGALDACAGPGHRHAAAGADGESCALRRIAAGFRRLRDAAQGGWARVSGGDECGKPADVRRAVVCGRVAHS